MTTYTTTTLLSSIGDGVETSTDHFVFLNFKSRNDNDTSQPWITNRIALKAETIQIDTNKTIPSFAIPFSGAITGESTTLAIDMGTATKNITINGIITEQVIVKKAEDDAEENIVSMTAFEVAQLLHSSVDSSFIQEHQNIGELIILIPSRIDADYSYHSNISSTTNLEECPLIPWTWASRNLDQASTSLATDFPPPVTGSNSVEGIQGFIRNFGTTIQGGTPFITFNLSFEVALVPMG